MARIEKVISTHLPVSHVPKDSMNAPKGLGNVKGDAGDIRPMGATQAIGDPIVRRSKQIDATGFVLSHHASTATRQEIVDLLDQLEVVLNLEVSAKKTATKGSTYALRGLLGTFTAPALVNILAIIAHDNTAAGGGIDVGIIDTVDTDVLGEGDGGSTGTLARGGGLQNASVSTQNSAHKTHGRRHDDDDDGGDGDVDAVKKGEEEAGANEVRNS